METAFTKVLNAKNVVVLKTIVANDPLLKKQMDLTNSPKPRRSTYLPSLPPYSPKCMQQPR